MDNRIFNVNGKGDDALLDVLKLAYRQTGTNTKAKAYIVDPIKGMILLWHTEGGTVFPSPLTPEQVVPIVSAWLATKPKTECVGWDSNHDHDGHKIQQHNENTTN